MGTAAAVMSGLPGPLLRPRPLRTRRTSLLFVVAALAIMALFYILLSLAPCMVGGGACYRGYNSHFSFDADEAHFPRWMADLPDATNLTDLSIPGTHDTMTYSLTENERLQCQAHDLSTQLNAGLRYFDIRARLEDDTLHIYHADGFTGFDFQDVLLPMFHFLDENPSETIIMRLKEEGDPIGDANTITFEDAFNNYLETLPSTSPGAKDHFTLYDRVAPIPTLGELRSRIFLIQNFNSRDDRPYGLAWEGEQMVLEDLWIIPDVFHLSEKWTAISTALETAATSPANNTHLYLSHVSASVGVLPIEAAAGPLNRTVVGMNDMTGQWLEEYPRDHGVSRTGVIIVDFPGKNIIDAVLRWNQHLAADVGS